MRRRRRSAVEGPARAGPASPTDLEWARWPFDFARRFASRWLRWDEAAGRHSNVVAKSPTTINALKAQRVRPAVEIIGIDVHKKESQICIIDSESGALLLEQRIATRADRFAETLGERSLAKVLVEASTESEWAARCIESLGHELIVADTNFAAM